MKKENENYLLKLSVKNMYLIFKKRVYWELVSFVLWSSSDKLR